LAGIPLLKFATDTGARAVRAIVAEPGFTAGRRDGVLDLAIVGGGVAGIAAALEARQAGLDFRVFEAARPFSTIVDFPRAKPIFTYPTEMVPAGGLRVSADVKEALVDELEQQRVAAGIEPVRARIVRVERRNDSILLHDVTGGITPARRVVIAIGRSGNFRKLGVPGENLDKVYNRLHDPKDFAGRRVLVVGGGDSALESACALADAGAHVSLSYRGREFSRPKSENVERLRALEADPDRLRVLLQTTPAEIAPDSVRLRDAGGRESTLANDVVFAMIGREAPLDFLRRSGIRIRGEFGRTGWAACAAFVAFCCFLYTWKAGGTVTRWFESRGLFPFNVPNVLSSWSAAAADPATFAGTLAITLRDPSFYYSLAYTLCIVLFGIDRMRRRRTPYVRAQTATLMAFQVLPLFLLPYVLLPWAGHNDAFASGAGRWLGDQLFPVTDSAHGREYWRAFGFVLAWPLFIWNFFTDKPLWLWLAIGGVQTFVAIPWMVRRWGKGAYCGWVCSCGALAETMGDRHRDKMPHGPLWNRVNMLGQVILGVAAFLFLLRILSWSLPGSGLAHGVASVYRGLLYGWSLFGVQLNYYHVVDILLAGIVGVGAYFWLSGRVWCRFACPLAALMHVYARFSRFRIFADKKKCISCNVCTSVCHQGIDVMNFANKGLPMADPECVRCSACVQMCPTGVLSFGRYAAGGRVVYDILPASSVRMREAQ
jgi:thioredoxin reductase/ferredoxin